MNEVVQLMAKRIVEKFNPQKIILFGSLAREDAGADSDIDLLIVIRCRREQKRKLQVAIRRELRDFKVPKDIIVACPEDVRKYNEAWWTVYHPALHEGRVLYEQ